MSIVVFNFIFGIVIYLAVIIITGLIDSENIVLETIQERPLIRHVIALFCLIGFVSLSAFLFDSNMELAEIESYDLVPISASDYLTVNGGKSPNVYVVYEDNGQYQVLNLNDKVVKNDKDEPRVEKKIYKWLIFKKEIYEIYNPIY